jgi:hypothetical protein
MLPIYTGRTQLGARRDCYPKRGNNNRIAADGAADRIIAAAAR